jgi:replicative DNA helicase
LLKSKAHALTILKEVDVEYFDPKLQTFFGLISQHGAVLSLGALLDTAISSGASEEVERYRIIYNKAKTLKVHGENPGDDDLSYWLTQFKNRRNLEIARVRNENLTELITSGAKADEVNELLNQTVRDIAAIQSVQVFDEGTVGEDVRNMLLEYEAIRSNPEPFRGVLVGYHDLDSRTNGFQPGELIIVAGLDGSGKSMLMMNMGINAWLGTNNPNTNRIAHNGNNILYFTLEMPRSNKGKFTQGSYLNKRILSAIAEVPLASLRSGTLDPLELQRLQQAVEWLEEYEKYYRFHVVDIPRGAKVADIESKFLEVKSSLDVDLVIVDYLGIMAADHLESPDHLQQGSIAAGLHELARFYNFPCLTAAQLNRPSGSNSQSLNSQKFNSTRIARSAGIPQNCNILIIIQTRDDEEDQSGMKLTLAKMRDAAKGEVTVTKAFSTMRILDGEPYSPEDEEISDFIDKAPQDEIQI